MRRKILLLLAIGAMLYISSCMSATKEMGIRAGVSKANITPPWEPLSTVIFCQHMHSISTTRFMPRHWPWIMGRNSLFLSWLII